MCVHVSFSIDGNGHRENEQFVCETLCSRRTTHKTLNLPTYSHILGVLSGCTNKATKDLPQQTKKTHSFGNFPAVWILCCMRIFWICLRCKWRIVRFYYGFRLNSTHAHTSISRNTGHALYFMAWIQHRFIKSTVFSMVERECVR